MAIRQALEQARQAHTHRIGRTNHDTCDMLENAKAARGERQTSKESYHSKYSIMDSFDAKDFMTGLLVTSGFVFLMIAVILIGGK